MPIETVAAGARPNSPLHFTREQQLTKAAELIWGEIEARPEVIKAREAAQAAKESISTWFAATVACGTATGLAALYVPLGIADGILSPRWLALPVVLAASAVASWRHSNVVDLRGKVATISLEAMRAGARSAFDVEVEAKRFA